MPTQKYKTINDLANKFVKINQVNSKNSKFNLYCNFEDFLVAVCMDKYTPQQVVAIEFDRIFIDDGSLNLIEIEI